MRKISLLTALTGICLVLLLFSAALPQAVQAVENEKPVSIFAGSGKPGLGDGILSKAGFYEPYGLTVDNQGRIYMADSYNNLVRVIAHGIAGTLAGGDNGRDSYGFPQGGYIDGAADKARFNRPRAVAVADGETLYVADTGNHVIRKIAGGQVSTFAGSGKAGYKDGLGRQAQFNMPGGLAVDNNGNVYVADTLNNVIRKITPAGMVSTYAGNSSGEAGFKDGAALEALFNEPAALALDSRGNLYVADSANQLIRRITDGKVETLAGSLGQLIPGTAYYQGGYENGPALGAAFNFPKGLTVLENGTVVVADTWNYRVRALLPSGWVVTLAGGGMSGRQEGSVEEAVMGAPLGIANFANSLYITDIDNNVVWLLSIDPDNLRARAELPLEEIRVWVDNQRLGLTEEAKPYIYKERTMLPLRAIAEKMGCTVDWDSDGRITVTRGEERQVFAPRDPNLRNLNGITMVGIRYLAESLGCKVDWHPEYRAVTVTAR